VALVLFVIFYGRRTGSGAILVAVVAAVTAAAIGVVMATR